MSDISFVTIDSQEINTELVNDFETTFGETLYPGDERRIFLDQETQVVVALKNDINETGKQNLLRYARGPILDAMGEFYGVTRLKAQKALVTLRFSLSTAQSQTIPILAGTRATPDGILYFATINDAFITPGLTYIDIPSIATIAGSSYNNFTAGQIKNIVDPITFISSVTNIDTSIDGSDIEPDDDGVNVWSGFRERIRLAPTSFSVAGPEGAYISFALSADSTICDVSATSPSAGTVKIIVLQNGGQIPAQSILDKVTAVASARDKRPLTDNVIVSAPTVTSYDITLTYYISSDNQTKESIIKTAIEGKGGAIENYISWQQSNLGKAINPDYLKKLILNAGAERVNIISPVYTIISKDMVAKVGTTTITYGGLE